MGDIASDYTACIMQGTYADTTSILPSLGCSICGGKSLAVTTVLCSLVQPFERSSVIIVSYRQSYEFVFQLTANCLIRGQSKKGLQCTAFCSTLGKAVNMENNINGDRISTLPNTRVNGDDKSALAAELSSSYDMDSKSFVQAPIAIVGMACRLPGHCASPDDFWNFMMSGGVASNTPPPNRFNLSGHFDSSRKPHTMKTPGAMFMEDVDPADFDAQFFSINNSDAIAMDPQQRNLMEVTYECLENAGMPIEKLSGQRVGCLVGASAVGLCFLVS